MLSPLAVIDAREIDDPASGDEVLALYVSHAEAGDRITLHAETCPTTRDSAWKCRCVPTVLVMGAQA